MPHMKIRHSAVHRAAWAFCEGMCFPKETSVEYDMSPKKDVLVKKFVKLLECTNFEYFQQS